MAQSEKLPRLPHADGPTTQTTTLDRQQKYHKYFVLATCSAYLILDVVASYLDHTVNNNHDLFSLFFSDVIFFVILVVYALGERTPLTHHWLSRYVYYAGWLLPLITVLGPYAVDWARGRNPELRFGYGSLGEQLDYYRDEPFTPERFGKQYDRHIARSRELGLPVRTTILSGGEMAFSKSKLLMNMLCLGFGIVHLNIAFSNKAGKKVPFP
ncbi:hypothetical protein BGZ92_006352 [Podila epicladia]|nr:hypothetical protein BGZ92_006352 [Podila epicladia]